MISKSAAAMTLFPILIVGGYIHFFGLNIPFWDQWSFAQYLMLKQQGLLTFADLLAQHNEHRPFFPRLIWFALAEFTGYNVKAEQWTNLLIAVLLFVFFIRRSIGIWNENGLSVPLATIPLLSLLVFNLGHRESWLQGFQTVMFLGIACVIVGFFLLAERADWRAFMGAIFLGYLGTYSMVNGLFFWLIGLVFLLINESGRIRVLKAGIWLAFSALCFSLYFNGWGTTAEMDFAYLFAHLGEWAVWLLNFLGAPMLAFWYVAWVFGILGIVLYGIILREAVKSGKWRAMLPYFAIAAFILVTTFTISLGRMEFGLRQSTVSRYLTMSAWYWASLIVLLPFANLKRQSMNFVYLLFTASLAFLTIAGGWVGYVRLHQRILPAYQAVVSGEMPALEVLAQIHPSPETAGAQFDFMRENELSAWGEIH